MFLPALIIPNYHITALTKPDCFFIFIFISIFPWPDPARPLYRVKCAPLRPLRQGKSPLLIGHALPEPGVKSPPSFYRCLILVRMWIIGPTDTARGEPIRTCGCATWADRASFGRQTTKAGFTDFRVGFQLLASCLIWEGDMRGCQCCVGVKYSKPLADCSLSIDCLLLKLNFWRTIFLLPPPRRNI